MSRLRTLLLLTFGALLLAPPVHGGDTHPRRVLLLYSYEREFSHLNFARLFRPELSVASPEPVDFVEVALQTVRATGESDEAILERLRGTIGPQRLDLVVTLGGPAASFSQKYRDQLFANTPVLLTAVDDRFSRGRLAPNQTAVMVHHDPALAVDSILELLPDTKRIVVVIGASPLEAFWLREVQGVVRRF